MTELLSSGSPPPPGATQTRREGDTMEVVYPRCCGLDVHKETVVACLLTPGERGAPANEVRTFGTMTGQLQALSEWLRQWQVTHLAMESTGVYVRRITARAIPPAGGTGSEGDPWVNDSPYGESQEGQ